MRKLLTATAIGIIALSSTLSTVAQAGSQTTVSHVSEYKCTVLVRATKGCVAFHNAGNPSAGTIARIRVMYNNATLAPLLNGECAFDDSKYCKLQVVAPPNYSIMSYDADAFAVLNNCAPEIKRDGESTWQDANKSKVAKYFGSDGTWKWYKVSGFPTTLRTYDVRAKYCW